MAILSLVKKLFGSRNQRLLKRAFATVTQINAFEETISALSDSELKAKTEHFREQLNQGVALDDLLPEAFAVVREASKRTLKMRHFDVQLVGGIALHEGKIAEMHTGEGKTLTETLPAYLNALSGKGVHVITVNDYLAKRDAEWMRPIYEFLGLTVGVILSEQDREDKKRAYQADITYGTNNEYGFDYLRDNMVFELEDKVQRGVNFAIIDEVDSILIDEARTPLIISGPAEDSSEMYRKINKLIPSLVQQESEEGEGDYAVDEKSKQVFLTEQGHETVEGLLVSKGFIEEGDSLYAPNNVTLLHHVNAALRAHTLFSRDVDYIVRNGEVVIVDEHTGRTMVGRRWSDGLHQAIEAKEKVQVQNENHTLASITFQNYFRLYDKLSGMTGTADTEAYEFQQIYGLEVLVIPTNRDNCRQDEQDLVFLSAKEKFDAVIDDIKDAVKRHQPVLLGTASIETSEFLSQLLKKEKITHQVLNAKFHEYEAQIIAQAGRPGTVTIATNMAGRGTDIVLGGNLDVELAEAKAEGASDADLENIREEWQRQHDLVIEAGGLYVIGSERHESRRIDNQLRGRSGRQGDVGRTRFYLSLDDDLMRRFAKPGMVNIMRKLHTEEGVPLESGMLSRGIENAQRKVEGQNFDIRKQLLQFDDVANEQRKIIYQQRYDLMVDEEISETITAITENILTDVVHAHIPPNSIDEQWDVAGLEAQLKQDFNLECTIALWLEQDRELDGEGVARKVFEQASIAYKAKVDEIGPDVMLQFEKNIMLQSLDMHWKDHLANMDYLRQSINLRGYAQKDPKQEYKRESFNLFSDMLERLQYHVISTLARIKVELDKSPEMLHGAAGAGAQNFEYQHAAVNSLTDDAAPGDEEAKEGKGDVVKMPYTREYPKVGRNDPCHCGSGKKFKQCHGKL